MVSNTTVWSVPRRDPLGRPASLGGHRSSCISVVCFVWLKLPHVCSLPHELILSLSHATSLHVFWWTLSLSGMHSGASHGCEFCSTYRLSGEAFFECLHLIATVLLDLALCLVVSGHASTQICVHWSNCLHIWWSIFSLSCFKHFWHRFIGCSSWLLIVNPVLALGVWLSCGLTFGSFCFFALRLTDVSHPCTSDWLLSRLRARNCVLRSTLAKFFVEFFFVQSCLCLRCFWLCSAALRLWLSSHFEHPQPFGSWERDSAWSQRLQPIFRWTSSASSESWEDPAIMLCLCAALATACSRKCCQLCW